MPRRIGTVGFLVLTDRQKTDEMGVLEGRNDRSELWGFRVLLLLLLLLAVHNRGNHQKTLFYLSLAKTDSMIKMGNVMSSPINCFSTKKPALQHREMACMTTISLLLMPFWISSRAPAFRKETPSSLHARTHGRWMGHPYFSLPPVVRVMVRRRGNFNLLLLMWFLT